MATYHSKVKKSVYSRNGRKVRLAPGVKPNRIVRKATVKHHNPDNPRTIIRTKPVTFQARRSFRVYNPLTARTYRVQTPITKRVRIKGAAQVRSMRGVVLHGDKTVVTRSDSYRRSSLNHVIKGRPIAAAYNYAQSRRTLRGTPFRRSHVPLSNAYVRRRKHRTKRDSKGRYAGSY